MGKHIYGFALKPDLVLYLRANVNDTYPGLIMAAVGITGKRLWTSHAGITLYDSLLNYHPTPFNVDQQAQNRFVTITRQTGVGSVRRLEAQIRGPLEDEQPILVKHCRPLTCQAADMDRWSMSMSKINP